MKVSFYQPLTDFIKHNITKKQRNSEIVVSTLDCHSRGPRLRFSSSPGCTTFHFLPTCIFSSVQKVPCLCFLFGIIIRKDLTLKTVSSVKYCAFPSFFFLFPLVTEEDKKLVLMQKQMISTSKRHAEQPFADRNTQQVTFTNWQELD